MEHILQSEHRTTGIEEPGTQLARMSNQCDLDDQQPLAQREAYQRAVAAEGSVDPLSVPYIRSAQAGLGSRRNLKLKKRKNLPAG